MFRKLLVRRFIAVKRGQNAAELAHYPPALLMVVAMCLFCRATVAGQPNTPQASAQKERPTTELTPGAEARQTAPKSNSSFLAYVPTDYTPDRSWPVIFCYHGAGGDATTWPFRQVTGGKGFIVVGMKYLRDEYARKLDPKNAAAEKEYFNEVCSVLGQQLKTDPKLYFMGGFSQGGYSTSVLGEQLLDKLAGLVILGAGRRNLDRLPPDRAKLRNKPIFVGVGAKDEQHNGRAQRAAKNYKAWGATVTFEEWPDLGHRPDQNSEKLREWLLDNGTLKRHKDDSPTDRKGASSRERGD